MANRVNVDISANVAGFVDGMNKASEAAQQYETETRKISDSSIKLNKELRKAKFEVYDLAAQYYLLDDASKKSQFGRDIANQLELAKQKAADLIDLKGDLDEELKNRASDTSTFDALADGLSGIASTMSAVTGVMGIFTDDTEMMAEAVTMFTTAESIASAAIKAKNLLQSHSSLMLGISKIQQKALTAAENLDTTAKTENAAATGVATAAENLNTAAKSENVLATGAATTAENIDAVAKSKNAAATTAAATAENLDTAAKTKNVVATTASATSENLDTAAKTKNVVATTASATAENLETAAKSKNIVVTTAATAAQKAFNVVAKANPYVLLATAVIGAVSAFALFSDGAEEATEAQKKLNEAEENGKKVSEAYSSTLASEYAKLMTGYSKLKAQWSSLANDSQRKKFIKEHKSELKSLGLEINNVADAEAAFNGDTSKIVEAFRKRAQAAALAAKMTALYSQEIQIVDRMNELTLTGPRAGDKAYGVKGYTRDENTKYSSRQTYNNGTLYMGSDGSLLYTQKGAEEARKSSEAWKELEAQQRKNQESQRATEALYFDLVKSSNLYSDSISNTTNNTSNNTDKTKKQINTYKEAVEEYDRLVNEQKKLKELITSGRVDEKGIKGLEEEIKGYDTKIQDITDKWHIKAKVELEPPQDNDISKINEILSIALHPKFKYDFSSIPEEFKKSSEETLSSIERIERAKEQLGSIMNDNKSSDVQIAAAQKGIEDLSAAYDKLIEKANIYQEVNDRNKKLQEDNEKLAKTYSDIGSAVGSVGDMFNSLSKLANDDPALQVMGIVAQAVANMFAGYAEASKNAGKMGPWAWVAFAAAGMAQTLALVAQIKNATKFSNGGIVGGSSYYGDNIYARLNSDEMVLNKRQQRNLFNLLDTGLMPQRGVTNIQVTGVVRGTDLLLVQKNTNKVRAKAGSKIYF